MYNIDMYIGINIGRADYMPNNFGSFKIKKLLIYHIYHWFKLADII